MGVTNRTLICRLWVYVLSIEGAKETERGVSLMKISVWCMNSRGLEAPRRSIDRTRQVWSLILLPPTATWLPWKANRTAWSIPVRRTQRASQEYKSYQNNHTRRHLKPREPASLFRRFVKRPLSSVLMSDSNGQKPQNNEWEGQGILSPWNFSIPMRLAYGEGREKAVARLKRKIGKELGQKNTNHRSEGRSSMPMLNTHEGPLSLYCTI